MNIENLVGIIIILTLSNAHGMNLGINEINEIGSLNNTDNVIFVDLKMATMWNTFWESISNMMMDL